MGRARTCANLFQGQASYRLLDHAPEPGGGLEPPTLRVMEGDALAKLSYPSMIDSEPRARFELAPARYNVAALPPELSRHGLGEGPRSRTTGLEGQYAAYTPLPVARGPGRTTGTCTSRVRLDRSFLRRLRLPFRHAREMRSRRRESNARPLTYQVSALAGAEVRRLSEGCRRQIRPCSCAEARHVLGVVRLPISPRRQRVARVGFQPTVSWMKARHVGRYTNGRSRLVPPPGVEPGTARVRTVCSGQLSYGGI